MLLNRGDYRYSAAADSALAAIGISTAMANPKLSPFNIGCCNGAGMIQTATITADDNQNS